MALFYVNCEERLSFCFNRTGLAGAESACKTTAYKVFFYANEFLFAQGIKLKKVCPFSTAVIFARKSPQHTPQEKLDGKFQTITK